MNLGHCLMKCWVLEGKKYNDYLIDKNFSAVCLFDYFVKSSDISQIKLIGLFEKHEIFVP